MAVINKETSNESKASGTHGHKIDPQYSIINSLRHNIIFIATSVYILWTWLGILFYKYFNGWSLGTSYFYAMEAGLSIGFCEPTEASDWSKLFTIFFVVLGSTIVSGSLGAMIARMVYSQAELVPNHHNHGEVSMYDEETQEATFKSVSAFLWYETKVFIGWYSHRTRVILIVAFLCWMALGTTYGVLIEDWSIITAFYWYLS